MRCLRAEETATRLIYEKTTRRNAHTGPGIPLLHAQRQETETYLRLRHSLGLRRRAAQCTYMDGSMATTSLKIAGEK